MVTQLTFSLFEENPLLKLIKKFFYSIVIEVSFFWHYNTRTKPLNKKLNFFQSTTHLISLKLSTGTKNDPLSRKCGSNPRMVGFFCEFPSASLCGCVFCFLQPVTPHLSRFWTRFLFSATERAGIFANTLLLMTHVLRLDCQFYPSVALVPGVTDSDKPLSPLKRKPLESTVLNDTPSRKIVCTYKEGSRLQDAEATRSSLAQQPVGFWSILADHYPWTWPWSNFNWCCWDCRGLWQTPSWSCSWNWKPGWMEKERMMKEYVDAPAVSNFVLFLLWVWLNNDLIDLKG